MWVDYKNVPIEDGASDQDKNDSSLYQYDTFPEKISQVAYWVSKCNFVDANLIMVFNPRSVSVHDGNPSWYLSHIKGIPTINLRNFRKANEDFKTAIARLKEIYEERRLKSDEDDRE